MTCDELDKRDKRELGSWRPFDARLQPRHAHDEDEEAPGSRANVKHICGLSALRMYYVSDAFGEVVSSVSLVRSTT